MLVMELLEGGSLRDKVKSGDHLTVTQRLRLCCDAAMGLGWLHKSNPMIIHRDFVSESECESTNIARNLKICC